MGSRGGHVGGDSGPRSAHSNKGPTTGPCFIVSDNAVWDNGLGGKFVPTGPYSLGFVTSAPSQPSGSAPLVAGFVCGLEALLLVGAAAAYLAGVVHETESSLPRTLASMALFLVGALLLGAMARAWLHGASWPRMATLVVNALLVPVSITVIRGNGPLVGVPLLALAVCGVVAAIRAGDSDPSPA